MYFREQARRLAGGHPKQLTTQVRNKLRLKQSLAERGHALVVFANSRRWREPAGGDSEREWVKSERLKQTVAAERATILRIIRSPPTSERRVVVREVVPKKMPSIWEEMTVADVVSNVFVEVATLVFIFFVGAMFGSFVNVILYRMPRRINVFWPPSRCPACRTRLKLVDNFPVISYFRLGGKCRHCGADIPRSYWRIEAGFGLTFLAVTYLEIHSGGANLPLRPPNEYPGALWNLWYPKPDLLRVWFYHILLIGVLGTLLLFARRGACFPGLLIFAALGVGLVLPIALENLHLVPWHGTDGQDPWAWRNTGPIEAVVGLLGGILVGSVLALLWPIQFNQLAIEQAWLAVPPRWNITMVLAVVGTWLGWQAVLSVALLTALLRLIRPRADITTQAVTASVIQLATWRWSAQLPTVWPGPQTSWLLATGWLVALIALAMISECRKSAYNRMATEKVDESLSTVTSCSYGSVSPVNAADVNKSERT